MVSSGYKIDVLVCLSNVRWIDTAGGNLIERKPPPRGGDGSRGKKKKKNPGTQPKARAGWPKRLRLVLATP